MKRVSVKNFKVKRFFYFFNFLLSFGALEFELQDETKVFISKKRNASKLFVKCSVSSETQKSEKPVRIGVLGASGYTGSEVKNNNDLIIITINIINIAYNILCHVGNNLDVFWDSLIVILHGCKVALCLKVHIDFFSSRFSLKRT